MLNRQFWRSVQSRSGGPAPVSPSFLFFLPVPSPSAVSHQETPPTWAHTCFPHCVCVYACVCVRACMSMCLHSDIPRRSMDACAAQRRNSVNSAKQEMNEVMYGGASRWPSMATKGRARADGSRLRPLRFAAVVGKGAGGAAASQVCT